MATKGDIATAVSSDEDDKLTPSYVIRDHDYDADTGNVEFCHSFRDAEIIRQFLLKCSKDPIPLTICWKTYRNVLKVHYHETLNFANELTTHIKAVKDREQSMYFNAEELKEFYACLLYTSPSPRDRG